MTKSDFFVFDTNSLISASLLPSSTSRRALNHATELGKLAVSLSTFQEFTDVLFRKKFDRYFINNAEKSRAIDKVKLNSVLFSPSESITDCRDPKDNKFLELAVFCNASCIITGDNDLLELHPFRGIPILNPGDFLNVF